MNKQVKVIIIFSAVLFCAVLSLTGCMEWDYGDVVEDFNATGSGLFITNEGNFQYGNATLSYYDPATNQVQNEVFFRANGMRLGDVAQSM
ncbi:MAG: YncE family protein, partial [Paramuribaculum sp.]|nr:YncE family protein [Paramuribaculum sp.]